MKPNSNCKNYILVNTSLFHFNYSLSNLKWSNELLHILGYNNNELGNCEIFSEADIEQLIKIIQLKVNNISPFIYEIKAKANNGRWKFLCLLINEIENINELEYNVIGNVIDNTDLNKRIKKFERDESRYKAILKLIPDYIFVSNKENIIEEVYIQPLFTENSNDDYIGKTIDEILPNPITSDIKRITQQALNSTHVYQTEFSLKINKSIRNYEIRIVKIDNSHVLSIVRDISIKKIAEEKNKRIANELLKLNETKDKLFSIIGHDLKSPFNNILGFTELLIENFDELDKDKTREYVNFINLSARQAFNLLENLLEWSRSQSTRLIVSQQIFDIHKIIERNINLVEPNAHLKQITINNQIAKGSIVYADPNMISTVIRNILNNSIKFTNVEGFIELYTIESGKNSLTIVIKDNGIGMSTDYINRLFRITEHISRKGTAGEKGSGLGLLLCKDFMEKNNATMNIESAEGAGTTFYLTFPCAPQNSMIK
jgi:signal transduction histidine kinase